MKRTSGRSHNLSVIFPCNIKKYEDITKIISNLQDKPNEHLSITLEKAPDYLSFIQCVKTGDSYLIEVAFENKVYASNPQIYRILHQTQNETLKVFKEVVTHGVVPNLKKWSDVTREIFFKTISIKPFRQAYKTVRKNSDLIYQAFSFRHLADATQYYLHPNNQSSRGKTSLAQSIGESIILFSKITKSIEEDKSIGDYYFTEDFKQVYLEITIPQDYRDNQIVNENVYAYRALSEGSSIQIAAYNKENSVIKGDMESLESVYKLLPVFMVLLARDITENSSLRHLYERFISEPVVDLFVNLHEDFYQNHKKDVYEITYQDIAHQDLSGWKCYSSEYRVICENRAESAKNSKQDVTCFDSTEFSSEQQFYIPKLSEEFVLPEQLNPLCNAIAKGDILATLFHGPAGTGKTMTCKLICQKIGLPIMETVNCTENLDEFILGKFIPEEDKIVFKESFVTKAIRDGGAVVFEEINFAKPQYLAFLNSLLDDNGFVRLDNGDVVRRHRNFRFFATMNMGYFGTKELNQSLYNRFNAAIEIAELSRTAIERMLVARVPECKPMVGKIIGVYEKIKNKIESEELDYVISPRNLENWAKLAKYEGYINAAEKTVIPIAKCDRALEDTIRGIMLLYKWKAD